MNWNSVAQFLFNRLYAIGTTAVSINIIALQYVFAPMIFSVKMAIAIGVASGWT